MRQRRFRVKGYRSQRYKERDRNEKQMIKVRWRTGWRSWHTLIAKLQLILIYPGQERGRSALHPSESRRGGKPMTGQGLRGRRRLRWRQVDRDR